MATNQSFLDGMRASAGAGMSYTRPSRVRSADQNNTISGNPGYTSNMPMPPVNFNQQQPMSWQQQAMLRTQQQAMLAHDPTAINYIQPVPNGQPQTYGGQQQPSGLDAISQRMQQLDPRGAPTPQQLAQLRAAAAATANTQLPQNGGGMSGLGMNMGVNPGGALQGMFAMPRPAVRPRGYTPNQLAAGPSGGRFVRPMVR